MIIPHKIIAWIIRSSSEEDMLNGLKLPTQKEGTMTRDYRAENERRRRAVEKENDFLKKEVIGKGADEDIRDHAQNAQSNMERAIENNDENLEK